MQVSAYTVRENIAAEVYRLFTEIKEQPPMFGLGWPEVLIIAGVGLLIFGPKKIPEIGSAMGKTLRGFKDELNNESSSEYLEEQQEKDS
ncbi:twin-arginine translocase TatA/TatE family subunit [Spirulina sp. CS-785/01]|nr:twin-arginine translocase TatA/TatE family subunit [Spirulina sp. CS-785/01]MDB9314294.1 twin-arginine translocase TatA/TatE family subunit [Spirulina sp. CS-785/01]